MSDRTMRLTAWLGAQLGAPPLAMTAVAGDASARRYWRIELGHRTLIAMDAPPEREDGRRFARIAAAWRAVGLNLPQVLAADFEQGFLLISDLGTKTFLEVLDAERAERLYRDALGALILIQDRAPTTGLPAYDEALLRRELAIFDDWLLAGLLGLSLRDGELRALATIRDLLVDNALQQPQVAVHRDYHSRNLMVSTPSPGILDFQDAVLGPLTYDLVSLLRDCYIAWPAERVQAWLHDYLDLAQERRILDPGLIDRVPRWMDLMGVQRHLKAAGIFARLKLRDGRPGYLADIPRTLDYVLAVARAYPELAPLADLIDGRVVPAFRAARAGGEERTT
ncbi:phosphotransferase [Thioalkalicoccus limnaeus]|uniref:Phosphotransferase n=1 Tax=Thioalkalicoccus limnaeus TaxID=120681 RepID=A0ABV4BDI4_9GAMM